MVEALIETLEALDQRSTTVDVTLWADAADEAMRQAAMVLKQLRASLEGINAHIQQVKDLKLV
jgi:hypothetical protein